MLKLLLLPYENSPKLILIILFTNKSLNFLHSYNLHLYSYHSYAMFIIELYAIKSNKDRHDNSIYISYKTTFLWMVLGVISEFIVLGEIRDKGQ